MKSNTLTTLGIMVLSIAMVASTVTGCGGKETSEVQATEVVESVVETEAVEPMTEEVTEEPTEATEEVEVTETEEPETESESADAFVVKDMSATKYAKQKVNVRSGASADYETIGSLNANQKVTVTGQADTGWYRIDYNGKVGYVSGKYLVDQKVTASTSGSNTNTATNADNTNNASGNNNSSNSNNNSGSIGNTSAPSSNNGSNENTGNTGNTGNTNTPSGDTGNTSTSSTDNGSNGTASTGGATAEPSPAPSTPETPAPSTPETPAPSTPEDDPNCLGTNSDVWQGPVDDGYTNNEVIWE